MLDYVFFHKTLADEFVVRLTELSIHYLTKDDEFGFVVSVPEDLDDELMARLDDDYEALSLRAEHLLSEEAGDTEKQVAAVNITLGDGRITQALVRPELMNKILSAISFEELNELVETIAHSIESPDERPFCRR